MLNIVHWNCNSLLSDPHLCEIKILLNTQCVDVLLLSEAKIDEKSIYNPLVNFPFYNNFFFHLLVKALV